MITTIFQLCLCGLVFFNIGYMSGFTKGMDINLTIQRQKKETASQDQDSADWWKEEQ